jgi:ubiquinone/menaquinone biosynthesis C-methylase UbiE
MKQILSLSPVFRLFSSLVGTPQAHRRFVREAVQPRKGDRVLEFGCGCGDLVEQFNECDYVGIDPSENYIATAKRRFGLDGQFISPLSLGRT